MAGASTAGASTAGLSTAGATTAGASTVGASMAGATTAGATTAGAATVGATTAVSVFARKVVLRVAGGQRAPKSGRSQSNTRCVHDRTGASRCEIREHAVRSGRRFRLRRRRRSLPGPVGRGAGETRFLFVDIRRHARFWVGPPTAERCD